MLRVLDVCSVLCFLCSVFSALYMLYMSASCCTMRVSVAVVPALCVQCVELGDTVLCTVLCIVSYAPLRA